MTKFTRCWITKVLADQRYLKIDQSEPQTVIKGSPKFDEGITIKKDKPILLDGE